MAHDTGRSFLGGAGILLLAVLLTGCVNPPGDHPTSSPTASSAPTSSPSPTASSGITSTATPSSSPTTPANAAPGQVHGLRAVTGGGSGEVLLTWAQNSEPDVVTYVIYRATEPGGPFARIGTASRHDVTQFPGVPFVDPNATKEYYTVRAVDSAGQRGPSSAVVCGRAPGVEGAGPGDTC